MAFLAFSIVHKCRSSANTGNPAFLLLQNVAETISNDYQGLELNKLFVGYEVI